MGKGQYRTKVKTEPLPLTRAQRAERRAEKALLEQQRLRRAVVTQTDRLEVPPDVQGEEETADQARSRFRSLNVRHSDAAVGMALRNDFAQYLDSATALKRLAREYPNEHLVFISLVSGRVGQREFARAAGMPQATIQRLWSKARERLRYWCGEENQERTCNSESLDSKVSTGETVSP